MIIVLRTNEEAQGLLKDLQEANIEHVVNYQNRVGVAGYTTIAALPVAIQKKLPADVQIEQAAANAIQVSRAFHPDDTVIETAHSRIGGAELTLIAGPDSIESATHIVEMAKQVKAMGTTILRGGSFKPRTNPYSFQGLGEEGLQYHRAAADELGLDMMTEIMSSQDFDLVDTYTDIFQVGARNMQNFSLLKLLGKQNKPVGLKRGMSATIDDLLNAAEYIMANGNPNVFLIERGIRTFDAKYTRNTLDVMAVPVLRELTHLPVLVDPSHATGKRSLVVPGARSAVAAGAQGLMFEIHENPDAAFVDGAQAITPATLAHVLPELQTIHQLVEVSDDYR
ncbi:3-deoxy-7-phosphoheptulonate synthase [Weissella tructae]|uniref:3-deoxy-D-arabino-heptulosonate 7-phosphate (DAHP) synthase n=2 Tax=Weissella TaxID=46255 RepID=A0A075TZM3_9LACO|nr:MULTISPECIES: 3-deoxy-7-phosphoheptulonate synthase [Weissella]AIG65770.1 3-deoxy-D-arabino-heptulosonate 7-phosphate (DAHP) synthase [Weissella tructae]AIM63149.1 3-deoxy-D-arabino-heptulosonate 7-phosphate (DAHP) synthase [Weissella ceti]AIM64485.1 3-deoxy-D-arabino-heptulosonate 7-phosphate (DAHP) synthase [Weissella ceti]ELA06777.1 3-deoxy-7-phosphoheptulonate synthase [Weissella ceti NC36]QVV90932.1 3-deoxy-7-phosphoheptulonate synthase [Weissella tructae]